MATVVLNTVGSNDKYNAWIDATVISQNVTNNSSYIRIRFYVQRNDGYANSAYNNYGTIYRFIQLNWDGSTDVGSTGSVDTRNSAIVLLQEAYYTVTHNGDGNKTITIAGSCGEVTASLPAFMIYGNFTLPQINTIPTNITTLNLSPNPAKTTESCILSWGGATTPNYYIDYYRIYCRRYTNGVWSDYIDLVSVWDITYTHNILATYPNLKDGDRIQYKVFTHSSSGQSSSGVECTPILDIIIPSSVKIKVVGIWEKGVVWVKISNVWRKGKMWVKILGVWKKGK